MCYSFVLFYVYMYLGIIFALNYSLDSIDEIKRFIQEKSVREAKNTFVHRSSHHIHLTKDLDLETCQGKYGTLEFPLTVNSSLTFLKNKISNDIIEILLT